MQMFDATDQPNSVKCIVRMYTACGLDFSLFKDSFQDQKKENWILENVVKHKLLEKRTGQKGQEVVLSKAKIMHITINLFLCSFKDGFSEFVGHRYKSYHCLIVFKVLSTVQPSEVMQPPLELMQHTTRHVLCRANDGK